MEHRGYNISIRKGDNLRKVEVSNERGTYFFSCLYNAREFIKSCQFDKPRYFMEIIDDVFKDSIDFRWADPYTVIGTKILGRICAIIYIDYNPKKAEITFINPTPYEPHKPLDKLIREYRCDFYMYYHVERVTKTENKLIINFR